MGISPSLVQHYGREVATIAYIQSMQKLFNSYPEVGRNLGRNIKTRPAIPTHDAANVR